MYSILISFASFFADIDECRIAFGVCGNGTCVNEPGTYGCDCDPGFENHQLMQMCIGKYRGNKASQGIDYHSWTIRNDSP